MIMRKLSFLFLVVCLVSIGVFTAHGSVNPKFLADSSELYTYAEMEKDLLQLKNSYAEVPITVESLTRTFDGRQVYHVVVGESGASKNILITGAIHGREYITAQLVMRQILDLCNRYSDYMQMNDSVAFHFVPMINPDGVTISQMQLDGINHRLTRQTIYQVYQNDSAVELDSYLIQWKANARGVDLNRNFDALWDEYTSGPQKASTDCYKGTAPHCEPESRALVDLTEKMDFDATISYHTQGEVIYWYFGQEGTLLDKSEKLANLASQCTGYPTYANYKSLDPAGYKDWAIQKKGIPSLTIEVGHGSNPVPHDQMESIWKQNKNLIAMLLQEFTL